MSDPKLSGPTWNEDVEYRIAPGPKIRNYNTEEMNSLVGKILKNKDSGVLSIVTSGTGYVTHSGMECVCVGNAYFDYLELLDKFTHTDGSPCGVPEY